MGITISDVERLYEKAHAAGDRETMRIARRAMLGKHVSWLAATALILADRATVVGKGA